MSHLKKLSYNFPALRLARRNDPTPNQLIEMLEELLISLKELYKSIAEVVNFNASYLTPHVSMLDTTVQNIAVAGTPQVITFNTTITSVGITVTSSSRFTITETAIYVLTYSAQIDSSAANKTMDIWIRVSGTDVPNSNLKTNLVNAGDEKRHTTMQTLSLTAGQYVELWMSGDSTGLHLDAYVAGAAPTRPVTPSIFMTIDRLP